MSLSPYLDHRECSLTSGHPLSVACRCLGGRGTEKQRTWRLGSNGLQDTHSPPQRRCLTGRRNYRKDKWGGGVHRAGWPHQHGAGQRWLPRFTFYRRPQELLICWEHSSATAQGPRMGGGGGMGYLNGLNLSKRASGLKLGMIPNKEIKKCG